MIIKLINVCSFFLCRCTKWQKSVSGSYLTAGTESCATEDKAHNNVLFGHCRKMYVRNFVMDNSILRQYVLCNKGELD